MYLDEMGKPRPGATLDGPLAAGIPGQPAGLAHLATRYGRLPPKKSLTPATRFAEALTNCIAASRSEERRVGKECVMRCRSRWWPYH